MKKIAIGNDIEENKRFERYAKDSNNVFLKKIFTENEIEYCFSRKIGVERHLCARFCAKEATIKALTSLEIYNIYPKDIEIVKSEGNSVEIVIHKRILKLDNISFSVSISHCVLFSSAIVLAIKL